MRSSLVGFLVTAVLAGCAAPADPRPGPSDVVVELDAFSGRPNPRWTLSPTEAGEVAARLHDIPVAEGATLPDPVLGYRGFWIENPGGEGGIPRTTYVSRAGLIQTEGEGEPTRVYRDRRELQEWLLDYAERQGIQGMREQRR